MEKPDLLQILKSSKRILLVDWPDKSLPQALLNAGFAVFTYSPEKYSQAAIENGAVVFDQIGDDPAPIDIVNIFRPETEHDAIIEKRVLPLGAKVVWLHPPVTSPKVDELTSKYRITIIQGENIADTASQL